MTTNELIKLLQEEDPEGNSHIRMNGGIPRFVIGKEGYWDGCYQYFDENGNFVTSIEKDKVDIYCMDENDFVVDMYRDTTSWEDVKSKFKFKLDGYCNIEHRKEIEDRVLAKAEEAFKMMIQIEEKLKNE